MNEIKISGKLVTDFEYNYTSNGINFYKAYLEVKRMSGIKDTIPIITCENKAITNAQGNNILIYGSYKTKNINNHLISYVYANKITPCNDYDFDINELHIDGYICKKPIYRTTPKGKRITDIILANNDNNTSYIPCVFWDRNADESKDFAVSDMIEIIGRAQSREYMKDGEIKVAYEVSVMSIKKFD